MQEEKAEACQEKLPSTKANQFTRRNLAEDRIPPHSQRMVQDKWDVQDHLAIAARDHQNVSQRQRCSCRYDFMALDRTSHLYLTSHHCMADVASRGLGEY